MKERPILFSGPMVRAILEVRKTQTRRIVDPVFQKGVSVMTTIPNKYGVPGDRLWVRETWAQSSADEGTQCVVFRADIPETDLPLERSITRLGSTSLTPWRPSIFMPRWACRIILEITEVRVQRLQDISEEDSMSEGVTPRFKNGCEIQHDGTGAVCREAFQRLWDSINSKRGHGWEINPWVWCITFKNISAASTEAQLS